MVHRSSAAHTLAPEDATRKLVLEPIDGPELEFRQQQARAVIDLSRIRRETEKRLTSLLREYQLHGITAAQANALLLLFQAGSPKTARELAEEMVLSEVTVGRFVHALEASGWIERKRSQRDARAILLRPTEKAYECLPHFIQVTNTLLDEAFKDFERSEVFQLLAQIDRVRQNLDDAQALI